MRELKDVLTTAGLLPDYPRHYVSEANVTVEWLSPAHSMHTVLEYNTWQGSPEDAEVVERTRRVVIMECAHDAILKVSALLIQGDPAALRALLFTQSAPSGTTGALGFDFTRQEVRVLLNFR